MEQYRRQGVSRDERAVERCGAGEHRISKQRPNRAATVREGSSEIGFLLKIVSR